MSIYKPVYSLYVLFSQWRSQGNLTLCLLCIHMHLNNTKFERNSSLEYYHMTCIGKQNVQAKEVYWNKRKFSSRIYRLLSFMSLQGGSTLRSNPFYTAFLTEKVPLSYTFLSCPPSKMARLFHFLKPLREVY